MDRPSQLTTQECSKTLAKSRLETTAHKQDQDSNKTAHDGRSGINGHAVPEAELSTPLHLEYSDNMTMEDGMDDISSQDIDTVTLGSETRVKQLTVTLQLPGAKLSAFSSPDRQDESIKSIDDTQLGYEETSVDFLPTSQFPEPDARRDDQQMTDAEPPSNGATPKSNPTIIKIEEQHDEILSERPSEGPLQPTARADASMDMPMDDVQSTPDQVEKITESFGNNDQTMLHVAASNPISNIDTDMVMNYSSPPPEPAIEQSKTQQLDDVANSDGYLTDAEVVLEDSKPGKGDSNKLKQEEVLQDQVTNKECQSAHGLHTYEAAISSLNGSRQQLQEHPYPPSQQPRSLRPSVDTTEPDLESHIRLLELQAQQRKEALQAARSQAQTASATFGQGRLSMASALPAPFVMRPPHQLGVPYSPYMSNGYTHTDSQFPTYGYYSHGQMPRSMGQAQYSPSYTLQGQYGTLPGSNGAIAGGQYHQSGQAQQLQYQRDIFGAQSQRQQTEYSMSQSESDSEDQRPKPRPKSYSSGEQQGSSSTLHAPLEVSPGNAHDANNFDSSALDDHTAQSPPATPIDFALPRYEVQRQPVIRKEDIPSAKVSLPGLVREELLLSPDHADQELHLLLNLFLPAQQRLATPDPAPATAVLNFHNIALMVIEAFVQYEIGDEFGTGRGHWHNDHDDDGEGEYVRVRDATEANPDDIFFAVVDRWRAGIESGRKGAWLVEAGV
ncbi:hypothetical protein IAQ61_011221 [Plenodomus lingam]|uniref:uncharacterized protein n=1 Tax=Leptosphaeria maculans TaxID=5022 RepID=UPI00331F67B3|nr:hypothetical protein IAQ61_011221 [Plenodomus lingam]